MAAGRWSGRWRVYVSLPLLFSFGANAVSCACDFVVSVSGVAM